MFVRALMVLLLVLNLGVAAWWLFRSDTPAMPAPEPDVPGVARLRLVGETAPPAATTQVPPVREAGPAVVQAEPVAGSTVEEQAEAVAAPAQCFSIGPFDSNAAAATARSSLAARVSRSSIRSEAVPARGNWDVAIAPLADRAAAQAMAARIDAAGFKDYYVIAGGEGANGIALGRFGSQQAAESHLATLQAAGFPAELRAPDGAERHWLEVEAVAGAGAAELRAATGASQAEARACPAA